MKVVGFYVKNGKVVTSRQVMNKLGKVATIAVSVPLALDTIEQLINYGWIVMNLPTGLSPQILEPIFNSPAFAQLLSDPDMIPKLLDLISKAVGRGM